MYPGVSTHWTGNLENQRVYRRLGASGREGGEGKALSIRPIPSAGCTVEKVRKGFYMTQLETKVDSEQLKVQANS